MKITFRDGYKVELDDNDIKKMSKHEIIQEAMKAKDAVKSKLNDVPFTLGYDTKHLTSITEIKNAISRRDGHVLDKQVLDKQLEYLKFDLDADLELHKKYNKKHLDEPHIDEYDKIFAELERIIDPEYTEKYKEVAHKYNQLREAWGYEPYIDEYEEIEDYDIDEDEEDIEIHDTPLGETSRSVRFKNAPGTKLSKSNLDLGFDRAQSENPKEKELGIRLLKIELPDLKANIQYDIDNAAEFMEEATKEDLRAAAALYKEYIDSYKVEGLEDEYHELYDLYNKLYYTYHLNRRQR